MAVEVTFEILLAAAGADNMDELDSQLAKLADRENRLLAELKEVQKETERLSEERAIPIRAAVRAAKQLGIEVPKQYLDHRKTPGNRKSKVRYEWSSPGCKTTRETVSSAMWRLSKGSGGSGGNDGQGVLLSEEFWTLVKRQLDKEEHEIEAGEALTLDLPNGRVVTFRSVD